MTRLFISQDRLDRLIAAEKVTLDNDRLEVPALGGAFKLVPAFYVKSTIDGDDKMELTGRVRSEESLRTMGADVLHNSVIVGETAYECEPGFLGEVIAPNATAGPSGPAGPVLARRLGELPP